MTDRQRQGSLAFVSVSSQRHTEYRVWRISAATHMQRGSMFPFISSVLEFPVFNGGTGRRSDRENPTVRQVSVKMRRREKIRAPSRTANISKHQGH